MALTKQQIPILLRGLATKQDAKAGIPGELSRLENMRFRRTTAGGVELRKRFGWTSKSRSIFTGGSVTTGRAAWTHIDELLMRAGDGFTYAHDIVNDRLAQRGRSGSIFELSTRRVVTNTTYNAYSADCAYGGGFICYAYENAVTAGRVDYLVQDATTGATVASGTGIGGTRPRVVAMATGFLIFYENTNVLVRSLPYATLTLGGIVSVSGNMSAARAFDVYKDATTGRACVAYLLATGNTAWVQWTDANAAFAAETVLSSTYSPACMNWLTHDGSDGRAYLAASSTSEVRLFQVNTSTGAEILESSVVAGLGAAPRNHAGYLDSANSRVHIAVEMTAATSYNASTTVYVHSTAGAAVSNYTMRSVGLASRAFAVDGVHYVLTTYQGGSLSYQNTLFIRPLDTSTTYDGTDVVGRALAGTSGGLTYRAGGVASAYATPTGLAIAASERLQPDNAGTPSGLGVTAVFLTAGEALSKPTLASGTTVIPGAAVKLYDGALDTCGFHLFPEQPTITEVGVGPFTTGNVHQYVIVYERVDSAGRVHLSEPSVMLSRTGAGVNKQYSLSIPTLRVGAAASTDAKATIIRVYRSSNNGDDTTIRRVDSLGPPLINNPVVDAVTFVDAYTDAEIENGELLYSTDSNGILANQPAPPARFVATWGNYVVAAHTENPREFWVSKPIRDGYGLAFHGNLRGWVEDDITGVAAMDDKAVIFCRSRIYLLTGESPNDLGQGMPVASLVRTGDGTENPSSIAVTPDGVMFEHTRGGIYLLDRAFGVTYVGAAVEEWRDLTITAAVAREDVPEAWFVTSDGRALAYDWEFKQWSTHTNHASVDATSWRGQFVHLTSDGYLRTEVVDQYDDDGDAIASLSQIAWISPFGLAGFGRVYSAEVIGEYVGAHDLQAAIAYDFLPVTSETVDITTPMGGLWGAWDPWGSELVWGGGDSGYRAKIMPTRQKCSAIQLTISDVLAAPSGGFRMTGLSLRVGAKAGPVKTLPAGRMA